VRWLIPGKEFRLDTRCLDCGEKIVVRMRDEQILEVEPITAVGYMMSPFTKWREGSSAFN
jgi:hypothetical protein